MARADITWTGKAVNLSGYTGNAACQVEVRAISPPARGQPLTVKLISQAPMGLVMTVRLGLQVQGPKGVVFASVLNP
jgi:hypothetical protein